MPSSLRPTIATLACAAAASAAVWYAVPRISGHSEPWDAMELYLIALLIAGYCAGLVRPAPGWAHVLGAWAGQAGYLLIAFPPSKFLLVALAGLVVFSLMSLAGAMAARWSRGEGAAPRPH